MTFSLRRLIITIVIVLIIGATSIVSIFLSIFDLNHFRGRISDTVSIKLSQPVDLGQAHFSLKHGPSFAFKKILIGTESGPLHLTADQLFLRLEVLPLLVGKYKFSEVLFEHPDITLKIGQTETTSNPNESRPVLDQHFFSEDMVRSVRIKNGHFRIEDYRKTQTPFIIALEKLDMVIDDLSLRQSGGVDIEANLNFNNIVSPFRMEGFVRAGDSTPFWNQATYQLQMSIRDFASDILTQRYRDFFSQFQIEGRSDIQAEISGSPARGLDFNTVFSGRDLGLKLPGQSEPISARRISAAGTWQNVDAIHKLSNLKLNFDTMNFSGETTIDLTTEDPDIYINLKAPRLEMKEFNRFIKNQQNSRDPADLPEFTAGVFNLHNLEASGPLSTFSGSQLLLAIKNIDLEVRQVALSRGDVELFSDCSFAVQLAEQRLSLEYLKVNNRNLSLQSSARIDIEKIAPPDKMRISGQSSFNISNNTQPGDSAQTLLPEDGLKAELYLDLIHDDGTWSFKNNLLSLPSMKVLFQGSLGWKNNKTFTVDINFPEFNMTDLPLISPAIKAINPEGKVSAKIRFSDTGESPPTLQGTMALEHVHFDISGPLADLNDLNGEINLDWPRLKGENLVTKLGTSPINLDLIIPDLTRPRVDLAIKSESIRADELIFRSESTFLRDVDAQVSITDKALLLGPIKTRLDGGTDVIINGTIDNFPVADTRLTIEGTYGNIDEIIGLWISEQDQVRKKGKKRKLGLLEIEIKTDGGEIAHLPFESSEAHISYRDRTLVIHPLKLKSGEGFGNGQVLVEFRDDQPPLLRMSGHLEQFDALAVYQHLLQRKGIVTGKLRGDFYLEGTAGNLKEVFLPTSTGSFDFKIQDGVLEKLSGLSKTLTIFNIYPLFTSADSSKGVPFEVLRGHATLNNGMLHTDDMLMKGDVMNISLTGTQNLITSEVDLELGIMPLRTIDRLLTNIPLAGWILTGENKALVTAHFKVTGPGNDPKITAIPLESASKQTLGIFKRIFTLPVKIISDFGKAIEQPGNSSPLPETGEKESPPR